MVPVVKAGVAYVSAVFAVAFLIGALRVMLIAPRTGPLLAVALEVPLILALSWLVAGRVLRRWPLEAGQRLATAALAFALLMALELATALAFGQTSGDFLTAMTTPAGALGLAGQIGFALIPLFRQASG
ncbi:MAG: hypothetical protein FD150_1383 [Rhodobacteraceae bacterium]|nr:MAG: hypothetical protein FD150_1383 [Paracoccaceae bacterium]